MSQRLVGLKFWLDDRIRLTTDLVVFTDFKPTVIVPAGTEGTVRAVTPRWSPEGTPRPHEYEAAWDNGCYTKSEGQGFEGIAELIS